MSLAKALKYLYPNVNPRLDYRVAIAEGVERLEHWGLPGSPPTEQEIADATTAYDAAETTRQQEAATLKQQVLTLAQSAVGVRIDQLTAAQVRALQAILLWKEGALDKDGVVRPLAEWVR